MPHIMIAAQLGEPENNEVLKTDIANLLKARDLAWRTTDTPLADHYDVTSYGELSFTVSGDEKDILAFLDACKAQDPPVRIKAIREDDETNFRLV